MIGKLTAAAGALALLAWGGASTAQAARRVTVTYNYTGSSKTFIAPLTEKYDITAYGADGGADSNGDLGGYGAEIGGNIMLTKGEHVTILVGGKGAAGNPALGGGGGGGSFVVGPGSTPLVVAGGGGGAAQIHSTAENGSASITAEGGGAGADGGGGGGFKDNGVNGIGGGGGRAFLNGGGGGGGGRFGGGGGGVGGGGGGDGGGGGGGGYDGGAGASGACGKSCNGTDGFGGSSYFLGTPLVHISGENQAGNGFVTISYTVTPEPAAWMMMLLGIGGMGVMMRTRRRTDRAPADV